MAEERELTRPDRDIALEAARKLYPNASIQALEEILWTHTRYPFGDLDLWKRQLAQQKRDAETVFPNLPKL